MPKVSIQNSYFKKELDWREFSDEIYLLTLCLFYRKKENEAHVDQ